MRKVLMVSLLAAGVAIGGQASAKPNPSPALSTVKFVAANGQNLKTMIFDVKGPGYNILGSPFTYGKGSAGKNTNAPSPADLVTYTSDAKLTFADGFATIKDASATPSWYELIINPAQDFTAMHFSVQLTGTGNVSVYYLLAGSKLDPNNPDSYTQLAGTLLDKVKSDGHFEISGGTFDGIMIKSTSPGIRIFEEKQNSYTAALRPTGPVPEPATWAMMLLGMGGVGVSMRRKKAAQPKAA